MGGVRGLQDARCAELRPVPPARPAARAGADQRLPARGFGQYYTGLLDTKGEDKIAATSFTAGLFAVRQSPSQVLVWGRLRLGAGPKAITIERRVGSGEWTQIRALTVDGRRSFELRTGYVQEATYRLRWPLPGGGRGEGLAIRPELPDTLLKGR